MSETEVILERHTQQLDYLQKKVEKLENVMEEIRTISETLIKVANELKYTNEAVTRLETKMTDIENQPKQRLTKIQETIITAFIGGGITILIGAIVWVLQQK